MLLQQRLKGIPALEHWSNPGIGPADLWTPFAPGGGIFGDRRRALDLMAAPEKPVPAVGTGVNVVILDYGISRDWLTRYRRSNHGVDEGVAGGWRRYRRLANRTKQWFSPGDVPPPGLEHGHMIARNILSIAPGVRIWDVPLLPDTVLGPPPICMAEAVFWHIRRDLMKYKLAGADAGAANPVAGPWILVNAWGALNPLKYDRYFAMDEGKYWNNPDHFFANDMPKFSDLGVDVVFAAGNCGTPGGNPLCGEVATGPGLSIHGVNAHPNVLTVGAVRVDGLPIGGSAQGPGSMAHRWPPRPTASKEAPYADDPYNKPDLCAPSHFRETEDGFTFNSGTSAACGLAAGVLAALRGMELSQATSTQKTPAEMRRLLRQTATRTDAWTPRTGWGTINLARAAAQLFDKPAPNPAQA